MYMYSVGPFTNEEMNNWFRAGYFTMDLMVRRLCDVVMLPLGQCCTHMHTHTHTYTHTHTHTRTHTHTHIIIIMLLYTYTIVLHMYM